VDHLSIYLPSQYLTEYAVSLAHDLHSSNV
jgi:hypothetical protein